MLKKECGFSKVFKNLDTDVFTYNFVIKWSNHSIDGTPAYEL